MVIKNNNKTFWFSIILFKLGMNTCGMYVYHKLDVQPLGVFICSCVFAWSFLPMIEFDISSCQAIELECEPDRARRRAGQYQDASYEASRTVL